MKLENPKIIDKLYHYVYKTVNVLNDRFYIGIHSTNNLDDGYYGSGKALLNSIKLHGKENHRKEILFFFSNRAQASEQEADLVTEETIKNPLCMNLVPGGSNEYARTNYLKGRKCSEQTKIKIGISNTGKKKITRSTRKNASKKTWSQTNRRTQRKNLV